MKFSMSVYDGQENRTIIYDSDCDVVAPFNSVIYGDKQVAVAEAMHLLAEILKEED